VAHFAWPPLRAQKRPVLHNLAQRKHPRIRTAYRSKDPPFPLNPGVPHRPQPYSARSLALASWTVCHGMFSGASAPRALNRAARCGCACMNRRQATGTQAAGPGLNFPSRDFRTASAHAIYSGHANQMWVAQRVRIARTGAGPSGARAFFGGGRWPTSRA
jgi:hypothetical protein